MGTSIVVDAPTAPAVPERGRSAGGRGKRGPSVLFEARLEPARSSERPPLRASANSAPTASATGIYDRRALGRRAAGAAASGVRSASHILWGVKFE